MTNQGTKLDIMVNIGGAGPADAKKLLDVLQKMGGAENDAAKAAEAHKKQIEARQKAAQQAIQKGMGIAGGAMSGGPMGAMSAMGGTPAAFASMIGAAEQGMNKLARAAEIAAAANTTTAQRSRMLVTELIPFGAAITGLVDALTGTAEIIWERNQRFERNVRRTDAAARIDVQERAVASERNAHQARLNALEGTPMAAMGNFDRRTVGGMHAYQEQEIMLPAQDAARRSAVESTAARDVASNEALRERDLRRNIADLEGRRGGLNRTMQDLREREDISGVRNEAGINDAAAAVLENERQITAATAALNEQMTRSKEAGLRAAEAESKARKDQINIQRAELEVLRQREQRMAGIQQAAGSMSRGNFAAAQRAVAQVQRRGIGNVSAQTAALASQLAPEYINRQREQLGGERMQAMRGRLGGAAFREVYGDDFSPGNTLADTRRQQQRVQADVRVAIEVDERALARESMAAIDPVFRRLIDLFSIEVRRIESETRAGAVRASNATAGAAR